MIENLTEMKNVMRFSAWIFVLFLVGCSPKLGNNFYKNPEEILFQHNANLMPKGYNVGMMSQNYPGVLAIVGDEIIFDALGAGSRPWMQHLESFKIHKKSIKDIELSDEKALKIQLIIIKTDYSDYHFYMADAVKIHTLIIDWYNN